jgi:hypothetical protein
VSRKLTQTFVDKAYILEVTVACASELPPGECLECRMMFENI